MNKNSILQRSCCLICSMIILTLSSVQSFAKPQKEDIRLNLELKNVTLDSALDSIKAQSPFTFIVGQVDLVRKVSISMKNETIGNVCAKLFTPLDIDYKINGHYIYLSNRPKVEPRTVSGPSLTIMVSRFLEHPYSCKELQPERRRTLMAALRFSCPAIFWEGAWSSILLAMKLSGGL